MKRFSRISVVEHHLVHFLQRLPSLLLSDLGYVFVLLRTGRTRQVLQPLLQLVTSSESSRMCLHWRNVGIRCMQKDTSITPAAGQLQVLQAAPSLLDLCVCAVPASNTAISR
jgi:hypothetical protein